MMVIAIVSIMSSIAIPRYLEFQYRARMAEPRLLLGSIRTAQARFFAAHDCYMDVRANPATIPSGNPIAFDATVTNTIPCTPGASITFQDLELDIGNVLYFQYQCTLLTVGGDQAYACDAEGDLDGDGINSIWALCSDVNDDKACDGATVKGHVAPVYYEPVRVSSEVF